MPTRVGFLDEHQRNAQHCPAEAGRPMEWSPVAAVLIVKTSYRMLIEESL